MKAEHNLFGPDQLKGGALLAVAAFPLYAYNRRRSSFLRKLQGPESSSFWLGNEADLRYQSEVGDNELEWMRQYGTAWRRSGCLGREHLMLADPKALQYIFHTPGYNFPKAADRAKFNQLVVGKGLISIQGPAHTRQRKIIAPAFHPTQLKTFIPLFQRTATKARESLILVQRWKDDIVPKDPDGAPLVNVVKWFSRLTLDIIGEAGFGFRFGSLDELKTPLAMQYENLFVDSTLYPSWYDLMFKETWSYLPESVHSLIRYLPIREYRRFRSFLDYMRKFSREMVKDSIASGDGKDIMSVLLRANESEDPKSKISETEMIDQMATLLMTGHETSANALTWFFWEVAKHPESQVRIREEVLAIRQKNAGEDFSAADLDNMTYMQAAMKESMRLHPIIWTLLRETARDDVIPLAFPITLKSGEQISAIPVKKGTPLDISTVAYNRLPQIWGEDADEWRPERFLDTDKERKTSVGVFGNVLNFSSGTRTCLGWRFSIVEMQVVIATILENFDIQLPVQNEKTHIYRKPSHAMLPMVEGEKGAWMGLHLKPLN
ncbi:cytochrome P450 [Gloeopeniophorella convolvens]|nr:cytochrome P450 [Gloeopeniophorella convolvens]